MWTEKIQKNSETKKNCQNEVVNFQNYYCAGVHSPLTSSLAEYSPTVRTKTIWGNLQQKKFVEDFFKYLWTLFNMYIIYQFKNCPIKLEFVSSKNLNCNFTDFDGSELRRSTKILVIIIMH